MQCRVLLCIKLSENQTILALTFGTIFYYCVYMGRQLFVFLYSGVLRSISVHYRDLGCATELDFVLQRSVLHCRCILCPTEYCSALESMISKWPYREADAPLIENVRCIPSKPMSYNIKLVLMTLIITLLCKTIPRNTTHRNARDIPSMFSKEAKTQRTFTNFPPKRPNRQ